MSVFKSRFATVFVAAAVLVLFSSLSAVGASMITSSKIKNGTVRSVDIHNGTIGMRDLNAHTKGAIQQHSASSSQSAPQLAAPPGRTKYDGPNWSIIDRNVEGNGDAYLRSGPTEGGSTPPAGVGSLGIRTGSATDKTAFGNEVDFAGDRVADLSNVSYSVFVTGEDLQRSPWNAPSVTFEIDPNLESSSSNYSSLVFVTNQAQANTWTSIDATEAASGYWFLTGAAGDATHCTQAAPQCSLAQIKDRLDDGGADAVIGTVAITKGKDYPFSGAADALRINDTTYDFEPFGVSSN
jgi:hypothetical protein